MILSLIFSIVLIISLWLYFSFLKVLVFQVSTSTMEPKMKGRPNRRTVGRRNDDVTKAILSIFSGYFIICFSLYVLPDFERYLQGGMDLILKIVGVGAAMFLISPVCRSVNAYIELCHIGVIHFVASLSAGIAVAGLFYDFQISVAQGIAVTVMVVGAMMTFSRHTEFVKEESRAI
jgi:hypothetical protein